MLEEKEAERQRAETIAAHVLRRYHCGHEHYNCRVEHTIDVIRVAAAVCDTLASTYEHITTEELYERVTAAVAAILHESQDAREDSNADLELDAESECRSCTMRPRCPETHKVLYVTGYNCVRWRA